MNKNLDLTEILKNCPKGTKLYSTIYGDVYFECISPTSEYPVRFTISGGNFSCVTSDGLLYANFNGDCTIFPSKEQRDWSKWNLPFVDGDIIFTRTNNLEYNYGWLSIFKEIYSDNCISYLDVYLGNCNFHYYPNVDMVLCSVSDIVEQRLATEEEKQKLFNIINENGYKWDADKKKLEKLIIPKFKIGDTIQSKINNNDKFTITNIDNDKFYYGCGKNGCGKTCEFMIPVVKQDNWELALPFVNQDNYELVPNKFNPESLNHFDKVLCRMNSDDIWRINLFEKYTPSDIFPFSAYSVFSQCIPYKGNECLLGTKDDCEEYYKIW